MVDQCEKWPEEEFQDLDKEETYQVDRSDMYGFIRKSAEMVSFGLNEFIGKLSDRLSGIKGVSEILVCGMGGSAISGEVAYAAVRDMLKVPYRVVRYYCPQSSIKKSTLLVIVSYSGNTEESIWAYTQGHDKGANVVTISSGGALAELSARHGHPHIRLPGDCPAPRLALGYLVAALLAILEAVFDEVNGLGNVLDHTVTALKSGEKRFDRDLPLQKNIAKKLAMDIHQAFPVIIGSDLTWPAALRFQTQLNENAKWPAHASMFPEMNHNEIVAYTRPGPLTRHIGAILLRDADDHPRVQLRQDFTADMLETGLAWVRQLKGEGMNPFARLMNLIQIADYTSYYLACGRGIDPMEINAISILKERMGKAK
jgi:glucose/mannose-6-phosphate isomerase